MKEETCWAGRVTDAGAAAGDMERSSTGQVGTAYIDKVAPAAGKNLSLAPSQWTNSSVVATIYAGDDTGGSGIKGINCSKTETVPTTTPTATSCSQTYTENGTLYYRTRDNAGNWSILGSVAITNIEKIPPSAGSVSPSSGAGLTTWTNAPVTLTVTKGTDAASGAVQVYCRQNSQAFIAGDGNTCVQTFSANGTLEYYTKDAAGNVSSTNQVSVSKIDTTLPQIQTTLSTDTTWVGNWTNGRITATAAATDSGGSGVAHVYCKLQSEAAWVDSTAGQCARTASQQDVFLYYTVDGAGNSYGNSSAPFSSELFVDRTAPQAGFSGAQNGGWYVDPQTISSNAMDSQSGLASQAVSIDGVTWSETLEVSESSTIYCRAEDQVGNIRPAAPCGTINFGSGPVLGFSGAAAGGWYKDPVEVFPSAISNPEDVGIESQFVALSNLPVNDPGWAASATASSTVSGSVNIYCKATDLNGLTTHGPCGWVKFDLDAPQVNAAQDNADWTNQPVTVTATASDPNGSGVAYTYCKLDGEAEYTQNTGETCSRTASQNTTFSYYAVDQVGNASAVQTYAVENIDLTVPTITLNVPTNLDANPNITLVGADSQSAIAGYTVQRMDSEGTWVTVIELTSNPVIELNGAYSNGRDRIRAQAIDTAGNAGSWADSGVLITASVVKYYAFGSQTVMEKRGDAVIYLSTDQISSTSLTTDANGAEISQVRYDPYGAVRWSSGTLPTDKTFTGQPRRALGCWITRPGITRPIRDISFRRIR